MRAADRWYSAGCTGWLGSCRGDPTSTTPFAAPRHAAVRSRCRLGHSLSPRRRCCSRQRSSVPLPRSSPDGVARSTSRLVVSDVRTEKIVVVMPALNAARTLEWTVSLIPRDFVDEIIVVDDGSTDSTVEVAQKLG